MAASKRARAGRRKQALALLVGLATQGVAQAEAQQEDTVLPDVKVVASSRLGATTEGTKSYTTGKSKTATPLSMSLRDTPQSVSVVTQQRIEDQGLQTILDVVNNATGVSVNRYETNRAQFTARGFDINNLMIDGVPTTWDQPWSSGEVMTSLAIYDRVELVRGATGLMTGAGDPSAAINLVRKRANSKELKGSVELGASRWDQYRALADVSTPLNQAGTVRGRVAAEYQDGDSWVDLMGNKAQTLYGTMEVDLSQDTLLSFGVSHQENNTDSPMWGGLPVWYADGTRTHWDRSKTTSADWSRWDSSYTNYFANLEHNLGEGWKVKASYSRGERDADSYLLYLFGAPDRTTGLGMGAFAGSYKTQTVQDDLSLQASGPFKLAGRTHEMAFGYSHSRQQFDAGSRAGGGGAIGDFNNWDGSYPEPAWGPVSFYEESETTQDGLYGVARFNLADPLKLILGTRVSNYEKKGDTVYGDPYTLKEERKLTPYAGLIYDINDNYSAYVSYTDIFLPQNKQDINGRNLDPILGKSMEAGVKGELLGGRLNGSAAVFRIVQDNLAQAAGMADRDGDGIAETPYYSAAEGATSKGFELEVSGELAQGWNATASYTQFSAKDATGKDVNSIYPRKLIRTFTTYKLPGALNKLTVGGGVNWEDRTYTDVAGTGRIEQKAYSLVSLMARYDISKQLSTQLNVSNALDEEYFGMFDAYGQITYGAPRSVSASVKYKF